MRTLQLARVAAEAEALRLRHNVRRTAVRTALGLAALCFLLGAIILCHVAAWWRLSMSWDAPSAALMVAGADLVVAVVLALLATRSSPGRVEAEALALRRRALDNVGNSLILPALVTPLLPLATRLFRRR
jgi:uncharacterized membrane protein